MARIDIDIMTRRELYFRIHEIFMVVDPANRRSVFSKLESVFLPLADRVRFDKGARASPWPLICELLSAKELKTIPAPVVAHAKTLKPLRNRSERERYANFALEIVATARDIVFS